MKLFARLYDQVMIWSRHRHAVHFLAINSFIESVFWPIPPDVMLAPMCLAKPEKSWRYALIASLSSALGGLAGYLLGYWLFDVAVLPAIEAMGYQANFELIKQWFAEWDFWVVFLAGFSPIPYKLFTVTAGMMHMAVVPFMIASIISRSARFFLVAALMKWGGAKMEQKLRQYIDLIGWLCVVAAIAAYFVIKD